MGAAPIMGAARGLVQRQPQTPRLLRGEHRRGSGWRHEDDPLVLDQHRQRAVPTERIVAANGPSRFSHRYGIGSGNR